MPLKRIKMSDQRRAKIIQSTIGFYLDEFDEEISEFRAAELLDFMLKQIGPSQYNQAVSDVRKFMAEKVEDLDTEFFEQEDE